MREVSTKNFGLLIAFLLPGFTALWGASYFSATIRAWLGASSANPPTVGGFLYLTLVSVGAGIRASTIRWMTIDKLHAWTGLTDPRHDFSKLQDHIAAYDLLVEKHYRFYQFYSNMIVSLAFVFLVRRWSLGFLAHMDLVDLGLLILLLIFAAGSRDTLRKYYSRTAQFLAARAQKSKVARPAH